MNRLSGALLGAFLAAASLSIDAAPRLEQVAEFAIAEANQGVGIDKDHFYAVNNREIAKVDRKTGKLVKKWEGPKDGPVIHLDSAMVMDGKIYAAHSNWPFWPMTSSLEIFDAATMEHVGTHSFGIRYGSLTWVDWHDGHWWMGFANYDRLIGPNKTPYGHKVNTVVVKMTKDFQTVQMWTLPKVLLDKFEEMSNSGGSWGPDGFLYLTGHDPAELYRVRFPKAGSILELADVIPMNIRGQGVAWDRANPGTIAGIIRATKAEREAGGKHKVTIFRFTP
ncbi:MAG: cycloisomerase [Betaproteobacteria bacterium]|nr:cycloisomerase [Betaproteobacteria bacterium]